MAPEFMMPSSRKANPRAEYRLLQTQRIEASDSLAEAFPALKSLSVSLEFFDPSGLTRTGGMKIKPNLKVARSILFFNCPSGVCSGGDYDLTEELARAIASGKRTLSGEMRCLGVRRNKETKQSLPCGSVLRYRVTLGYRSPNAGLAASKLKREKEKPGRPVPFG